MAMTDVSRQFYTEKVRLIGAARHAIRLLIQHEESAACPYAEDLKFLREIGRDLAHWEDAVEAMVQMSKT